MLQEIHTYDVGLIKMFHPFLVLSFIHREHNFSCALFNLIPSSLFWYSLELGSSFELLIRVCSLFLVIWPILLNILLYALLPMSEA